MEDIEKYIKNDTDIAFEYELQHTPDNILTWRRYLANWKSQLTSNSNELDKLDQEKRIIWLYERFCNQFPNDSELWEEFIQWLIDFNVDTRKYNIKMDIHYQDICKLFQKALSNFDLNISNGKALNSNQNCEKLCLMYVRFSVYHYDLSFITNSLDMSLKRCHSRDIHSQIWELILHFIYEKQLPLIDFNNSNKGEDANRFDFYLNSFPGDLTNFDESEEAFQITELLIGSSYFSTKNSDDGTSHNITTTDSWSCYILYRYLLVCPPKLLFETLGQLIKTRDYKNIKLIYDIYLSPKAINNTNRGNPEKKFIPDTKIPFILHLNYLKALDHLKLHTIYSTFLKQLYDIFPANFSQLKIIEAKYFLKCSNVFKSKEIISNALDSTNEYFHFIRLYNFFINFEECFIEVLTNNLFHNINKTDILKIKSKDDWLNELNENNTELSNLLDSNELKLNDLKLRQNQNDIQAWFERIEIFKKHISNKKKNNNNSVELSKIYVDAILKIDPYKVNVPGSFGKLWCDYSDIYWNAENFDTAREICNRALMVPFLHVLDLEIIWAHWCQKESLNGDILRQIKILQVALEPPQNPNFVLESFNRKDRKIPAQALIFNSSKLWDEYLQLLEAAYFSKLINLSAVVEAYDKCIALQVASPMTFINYAQFFEISGAPLRGFQVYERAISVFPPETKFEIWKIYIPELLELQNKNATLVSIERIRDIFDEAIETLQEANIDFKDFYLLYSDFEEKINGLSGMAVSILYNAALYPYSKNKYIPPSSCIMKNNLELWDKCFLKAARFLEPKTVEPMYEQCIKLLPNSKVTRYIIQFTELEISLNQISRARDVLIYGSKLLPPSNNLNLWEYWEKFEIEHGTEESFKEMFRLKRTLTEEMCIDTEQVTNQEGHIQFVASSAPSILSHNKGLSNAQPTNSEEIDLDI
ncbi:hypothetical protein TBLA_0D01710 [Henningerozyma blattae CBS 6284]|uniref:Pre-mRNA-splicing factor SYF1 n=1 Tax=Henningerozyma blattae (strain ATCC 34711 / CBS 6284 / DSM 70876 / NBRC 10599 / NRRL Y-10934 / UCD 77-7) TaxID=1071380 RepID=I2H2S7_HENB6|nr:hypothetical protein TBLA_0D01710 [Tetrapisispora blattae CBS 6284]CCH60679.1 hypothetical protein TBLA_0D01710 [Tetrapisispora blattae CBS 6284]